MTYDSAGPPRQKMSLLVYGLADVWISSFMV
jgi:hypothetical protein